MSFSSILSQDITDDITPPAYSATLGSREQIVFRAYQNEPWLAGTASNLILDKKLVIVDRELLFQVLMVENITKSKLTQIDDIKTKLDRKNRKWIDYDQARKEMALRSTRSSLKWTWKMTGMWRITTAPRKIIATIIAVPPRIKQCLN